MKYLKRLLPFAILGICVFISFLLFKNRPKAKKRPRKIVQVRVLARHLQPQSYQVKLQSYGTIRPRTRSILIPEVTGKVIRVSKYFQEGSFFEKGETLLEIEPRDYMAKVQIAKATLDQAKLKLKEEQVTADRTLRNWLRTGRGGQPDDLESRKNQVALAKSTIAIARTQLDQAKLNLERTKIKAPYAGRILSKKIDIGQVLSQGTIIAEIYATDSVEARIPLNQQQLRFVTIPEQYRNSEKQNIKNLTDVIIQTALGEKRYSWKGKIIRAEGAIDTQTHQLFVIVKIPDPYGKQNIGKPTLKIGQFVEATIYGHYLKKVFLLPTSAVFQGNQVMLIQNQKLQLKKIQTIWRDHQFVVVKKGLQINDLLSLTSSSSFISGMSVVPILGQAKDHKRKKIHLQKKAQTRLQEEK